MDDIIKLRDKKVEQMGQDLGDGYVLLAKLYFASIDTVKDIKEIANNPKVDERVIELDQELKELEAFYSTNMKVPL